MTLFKRDPAYTHVRSLAGARMGQSRPFRTAPSMDGASDMMQFMARPSLTHPA